MPPSIVRDIAIATAETRPSPQIECDRLERDRREIPTRANA
ncbi:hypothetical protein [Baaleninema simplex]|nr:hypothetical protein [Baaleninema simplex]